MLLWTLLNWGKKSLPFEWMEKRGKWSNVKCEMWIGMLSHRDSRAHILHQIIGYLSNSVTKLSLSACGNALFRKDNPITRSPNKKTKIVPFASTRPVENLIWGCSFMFFLHRVNNLLSRLTAFSQSFCSSTTKERSSPSREMGSTQK